MACLGLIVLQGTLLTQGTLLRDVLLEDVQRVKPGAWSAEHHSEGLSSTVTVLRNSTEDYRVLYLDTFVAAATSHHYGYMSLLGYLPMILHEDPREILVIAFGSGTTSGAIAMYDFERLDIVEIESDVLETAPLFAAANRDVLNDPRTRTIIDDGRNHVLTTEEKYDVITLEPLVPYFPAAIHLYTRDFYELSRARLKPGGIVCQWLPHHTQSLDDFKMLLVAFEEAFPYTYVWDIEGPSALIGSERKLEFDLAALRSRIGDPRVRAELARLGFGSPAAMLSRLILAGDAVRRFAAPARPVTDDRPSVEFFSVPKQSATVYYYNVLSQLYRQRADPVALLADLPDREFVDSIERESRRLCQWRRHQLSAIARTRVLADLTPAFHVEVIRAGAELYVGRDDRTWMKVAQARAGDVYGVMSESDWHFHVRLDGNPALPLAWIVKDAVEIVR